MGASASCGTCRSSGKVNPGVSTKVIHVISPPGVTSPSVSTGNAESRKSSTSTSSSHTPKWRKVLTSDGTLPVGASAEMMELRGFLDDPLLVNYLIAYGKHKDSFDCLSLWADVLKYKALGVEATDFRRSTAEKIYTLFLKSGSNHQIKYPSNTAPAILQTITDEIENKEKLLLVSLFDALLQESIAYLFDDLFLPFKKSSNYTKAMDVIHKDYNKVSERDFEYMELLGEGHFGIVVHARKMWVI